MRFTKMVAGVGSVCVATAMVITPVSAAETRDSNDVKAIGSCSDSSRFEAELSFKGNSLEAEFEIDATFANESWTLTMKRNGSEVYSQSRTTYKDSDDVYAEVDWKTLLPKGSWATDEFTFNAVNTVSGETCDATLQGSSLLSNGNADNGDNAGGASSGNSSETSQKRNQKRYTKQQAKRVVKQHATSADCWSIIDKGVYDLTDYVKDHPGGQGLITAICGRNGTKMFKSEHDGDSDVSSILDQFKVGSIKRKR